MARRLSLRKRPPKEYKQMKREDYLEEQVFDRETRLALAKLRQAGHFDCLEYLIAKGKEANVYLATTKDGEKVAVKIYRIDTTNFIHMHDYLDGDPRFQEVSHKRYETVLAWTRKEYSNLEAFYSARIPVPKPLGFLRNILAMEFFGIGNVAYSTLAEVGSENPDKDYGFLLEQLKKIYQLGFVHADFSEYNVLVTDDGLKIIDCGQAVLLSHPRAEEFLSRDVQNLVRYFRKRGVSQADFEQAVKWIKDGKPILKGLEAV